MHVVGQKSEETSRIGASSGSLDLWDLLNRFGSLELVIGLSTDEETLSLIAHLKSVTKGLLEFNAVLLWKDHFSVLSEKEVVQWRRQFDLPFKSLRFKNSSAHREFRNGLVPVGHLPRLFSENGIRALVTYVPWKNEFLMDWDGEVVFHLSSHRIAVPSAVSEKAAGNGGSPLFERKQVCSPVSVMELEESRHGG